LYSYVLFFFFFQAEDGIRDFHVTGVQTCALPISAELAVKVFNKAFDVFDSIIERPRVFFVNMLQTAKLGFIGFFERKWTHLREGFTTWLFDAVQGSPIYIPRAFNFSEIFNMLGSLFSVVMEKVYRSI